MDYDRVIIEMLSRIQLLEDKVSILEKGFNKDYGNNKKESSASVTSSKKYRLLSDFLYNSNDDKVKLTFEDIEGILGFKPPQSAYKHRAFWANTKTHSIALSWMSVGYKTVEVNIEEHYIVFERKRDYVITMASGKRKADELISEFGNVRLSDLVKTLQKDDEI